MLGAGTSSSNIHYVSWDHSPSFGLLYYRLKQTDFDETSTYSNTEVVQFQHESDVKIYPNPAKNQLHVEWNKTENPRIVLASSLGQIIDLRPLILANKLVFNTAGLTKGVYFLRILLGNKIETKKVIIN